MTLQIICKNVPNCFKADLLRAIDNLGLHSIIQDGQILINNASIELYCELNIKVGHSVNLILNTLYIKNVINCI